MKYNFLRRIHFFKQKKRWWEFLTEPSVAAILLIFFSAWSLILIHRSRQPGSSQTALTSAQVSENQREEQYRSQIYSVISDYLLARNEYTLERTEDALKRWRIAALETETALLNVLVPSAYRDFHLGSVIAVSLEQSGIDDLLGNASDTGGIPAQGLKARGESKLSDAAIRWEALISSQSWLTL